MKLYPSLLFDPGQMVWVKHSTSIWSEVWCKLNPSFENPLDDFRFMRNQVVEIMEEHEKSLSG